MAQTEREALVTLYNATGGPKWKLRRNWNTNADLSQWHGVKTNNQRRVVEIWLVDNNLQGSLPPELGNLSTLRGLYLSGEFLGRGGITGPIPPELGNLAALQHLVLTYHQLSGEIPASLGQLSELQELHLYGNVLSGPIPPELGNLAALQRLYLNGNKLTGTIPNELGALTELRSLQLFYNKVTGPKSKNWRLLTKLELLSRPDNQIIGGPRENETISMWRARLQAKLAFQRRNCQRPEMTIFAVDQQTLEAVLGSEWRASDVQGTSATARRASASAHSAVRPMPAEPAAASGCNCVIS